MTEEYQMHSTSRQSANLDDIVLGETSTTRLILRPQIVSNPHDQEAGVKVMLVHQRRNASASWGDLKSPPLSSLRAGEEAKLILDCEKTKNLYAELANLYAISSSGGVRGGETKLVVGREDEVVLTDSSRARAIKLLLEHGYPEDVWNALIEGHPDLATKLSYARIQAERDIALQEFHSNLNAEKGESWWQDFFEKNTWIFGYGLNYKILKSVQSQPHYGGTNVTGRGGQRGDFLESTEATVKFTVLVEIKKPHSALLGSAKYRNGAWELGDELTGGVSQLHGNCRQWEIEGSRSEANREALAEAEIHTVQPKGILVIGRTDELDDVQKRNTFESFRRNLVNPEILTFDELYERARFIVQHSDTEVLEAVSAEEDELGMDSIPTDFDIPF
jgi:hypothetical protein